MYTTIKDILDVAVERRFAVIACSPLNMEMARGIISAASYRKAPVILLLGQNMMRKHAKAELLIPMIRTMAEACDVPVATCLDHGNDRERLMYSLRNGFSSIMYDGSLLSYEENVKSTAAVVGICHDLGMAVEGELGHVGVALNKDNDVTDYYTDPAEAEDFVRRTGVDCLAVSVGTAHGEYPKGVVPHINFGIIAKVRSRLPSVPLALHGGSGSGDENIMKAVAAGISKINVVTEIFLAARNYLRDTLKENPDYPYMDLLHGMEMSVFDIVCHWIDLSGSTGKSPLYSRKDTFSTFLEKAVVSIGE